MSLEESILKKTSDEKLIYREIEGLCLPMYMYFPKGHTQQNLRSAIVCIHGGSWSGRKDNSEWNGDYMNVLARYFALSGAVGIIFSYRNVYNPSKMRRCFKMAPNYLIFMMTVSRL